MSQTEPSRSNHLLNFFGILGAFLIFALILFVAYLPNRPAPADQAAIQARQETADAARAAGAGKLRGYEVLDPEAGIVRIPIEVAMKRTRQAYESAQSE